MKHSPTSTISLNNSLLLGEKLQTIISKCEGREVAVGENDTGILEDLSAIDTVLDSSNLDSEAEPLIRTSIENIKESYDEEDRISGTDAESLKSKIISCRHLIEAELRQVQTLPVDDSGILDTTKLLESPEELFSSSVWGWLDELPSNDIKEASRSLAVGNSTSAVILSLRAVEHCLIKWHEIETGEEIDAPWGMLLNFLVDYHLSDEKREGSLQEKLSDLPPVLSNLFYLKERRNSVNHPKEAPRLQVARQTLIIAVSTIEDIYDELEADDIEKAFQQNPLINQQEFTISDEDEETVYDYIQALDDGTGVSKNELYDLLYDEEEIYQDEADEIFYNLLMSGHIYEPSENTLKPI